MIEKITGKIESCVLVMGRIQCWNSQFVNLALFNSKTKLR